MEGCTVFFKLTCFRLALLSFVMTPISFLLSAYDAQVAGLYYVVKPNDTGFQVGCSSNSHTYISL